MTAARLTRAGLAVALTVSLILGIAVLLRGPVSNRTHVVAYFANSNGLFVGDEVRILGVPVGKVDKIEPQLKQVKISFWYNDKYEVPADATAAILSPSLVTSRAIQLTPAYTGGPTLQNKAVLPQNRTAVPVEWDDFRTQLEKLTESMQPTQPGGVSTFGALVNTAADNLRGQGTNIRDMLIKLSQSLSALGDHSILALTPGEARILDNLIKGHFGASSEDRENRRCRAEIEGIIAPFALRDLGAIGGENQAQFLAIKCNARRRSGCNAGSDRPGRSGRRAAGRPRARAPRARRARRPARG